METIGLKETSRRCSNENCGAKLRDTVLDWEVLFFVETSTGFQLGMNVFCISVFF